MKILIVGQYFWPENFRINEVANALSRAGASVVTLTGPPNYPDGKVYEGYSATKFVSERKDSIVIYRVPLVPRGNGSSIRLICNYLSFVVSASVFGPWLLRKQQFDVILVYAPGPILQSLPGILIGRIKRASVVTWIQDLWPESLETTGFIQNRWLLSIAARGVRFIYKHNDLLLVQSRSFIEPVRKLAGDTPIVYHPNPGACPMPGLQNGEKSQLLFKHGFNVVFAGNLGTVQALDTILNAADKLRAHTDLWWVLIGSGSRAKWLEEEVKRRGLTQVILAGRYSQNAILPILKQASALLVSLVRSPAMSQTVPSKIQAYLAAGRPIIASLDGEGASLVSDAGAGLVCAAEDADALRDAVLQLKSMSSEELERLGRSGRRYYMEHFDSEVLTARMIDSLIKITVRRSSAQS